MNYFLIISLYICIMKKIFLILFLISVYVLNAETHIVTSSADDGNGSLRKIVADASAGDTILFASNIDKIILTSGHININKDITIIGNKERKTTINGNNNSKIFIVLGMQKSISLKIDNLIIENGKADATSGGIDVYNYCNLVANNCEFNYNEGAGGGGVFVLWDASFKAINCSFNNNETSRAGGAGGAVCVNERGIFAAINCAFIANSIFAVAVGANYYNANSSFIAINCAFIENKS